MMRSQIPAFRLPVEVLDEEVDYILHMGIHTHFNTYVESMKELLGKAMMPSSWAPGLPVETTSLTCPAAMTTQHTYTSG